MTKKIFAVLFSIGFMFVFGAKIIVEAATHEESEKNSSEKTAGNVNYGISPELMVKATKGISFEKSLKKFNYTTQPLMTKEQAIQDLSAREEISEEAARKKLFPDDSPDTWKSADAHIVVLSINPELDNVAIKDKKEIGRIYFYCWASEGEYFHGLQQIIHAGYHSGSKIFNGTLQYVLIDPNTIHYTLNGHLHNSRSFSQLNHAPVSPQEAGLLNIFVRTPVDFERNILLHNDFHW